MTATAPTETPVVGEPTRDLRVSLFVVTPNLDGDEHLIATPCDWPAGATASVSDTVARPDAIGAHRASCKRHWHTVGGRQITRGQAVRRSIVSAALIVGTAMLTSCGDANPSASSVEPAKQNQWTTAGIVAESLDAALFLSPNGKGAVSFAAMDVDGVAVGAASIDKESKLVAATQSPGGDWLALISECVEDSGNPCADATLFRVHSKLEKIEALDLGGSVQASSILPIAGLRSGDFVLQSTTNEQVQIGTVPAGASGVDWIWESPQYDLAAIRQRANETQNFQANAGPRIDICAADAGFFWRFSVSTGAPIGMASEGAVSAPKPVSVPTIGEAPSFTCNDDKLVTYSYGSAGASVERKSWR